VLYVIDIQNYSQHVIIHYVTNAGEKFHPLARVVKQGENAQYVEKLALSTVMQSAGIVKIISLFLRKTCLLSHM
jgi:hypothetical protein